MDFRQILDNYVRPSHIDDDTRFDITSSIGHSESEMSISGRTYVVLVSAKQQDAIHQTCSEIS